MSIFAKIGGAAENEARKKRSRRKKKKIAEVILFEHLDLSVPEGHALLDFQDL